MSQPRWFAGLMTGTVLDGEIDVALIRTDGHDITEFGPSGMVPYPDRLRQRLAECVEAAAAWDFHGPEPAIFGELETETTVVQSDAVIEFVRASGVDNQHRRHRISRPDNSPSRPDNAQNRKHTAAW